MSEDALIRLENLRRLKLDAPTLSARVKGRVSYWHDMLAGKKSFGEKAARKIEAALDLPRLSLDSPQSDALQILEPIKEKVALTQVQQAPAATINVAMSAECQVVCNMLSRLPSDKIDAAMTGIIAAIAQARDSPAKQSMPEESATTKTRSAA